MPCLRPEGKRKDLMHRKSVALASLLVSFAALALAQNPRGTAETSLSGKKVSVEYGRPNLRGRDLLAEAPVGTDWRTGADKSTTFTTDADLVFGSTTIPKGSYSLFTKRTGDKTWTLVFNKKTGQWGTEHDASQDLASVPLAWQQKDSGPELFTMELSSSGASGDLRLVWGKHLLSAPFKAK
jgi:Protein of unknown function (DUF2911)